MGGGIKVKSLASRGSIRFGDQRTMNDGNEQCDLKKYCRVHKCCVAPHWRLLRAPMLMLIKLITLQVSLKEGLFNF